MLRVYSLHFMLFVGGAVASTPCHRVVAKPSPSCWRVHSWKRSFPPGRTWPLPPSADEGRFIGVCEMTLSRKTERRVSRPRLSDAGDSANV